MKKITLILLALASYIGVTLIAPVMEDMMVDFPQASVTQMEYVITITTITLLCGMFLSAFLMKYLRRKLIIMLGLAMVTLFGVLPCVATSITMVLTCRALLGVGIGLVIPLQSTYFAEYDEDVRSKLFGINSVLNGLLGAVFLSMIGLLKLSWRSTFLLYGIFFFILILCLIYLPRGEVIKSENGMAPKQQASILSVRFLYFCIIDLLIMACYLGIHVAISLYIAEKNIGMVAQVASFITTIGTLAMVVAGLGYAFLHQKCGRFLAPIFLGCMTIGIGIYALGDNVVILSVGFAMMLASQTLVATEFTMNVTQVLPLEKVALGSTILTSFIFAGQFISPSFKALLQYIFGVATASSTYLVLAAVMAILTVISCLVMKYLEI